jgi:hypothetical protein
MKGLLLSLIAPFLFLIMTPFNMGVVLYQHARTRGFYKTIDNYFVQSAKNIDCFGNANLKPLLDAWLIKKHGYRFGRLNETISSVLGKNQRDKTLTISGWVLVYILWAIDVGAWFNGGHCIDSIKK